MNGTEYSIKTLNVELMGKSGHYIPEYIKGSTFISICHYKLD